MTTRAERPSHRPSLPSDRGPADVGPAGTWLSGLSMWLAAVAALLAAAGSVVGLTPAAGIYAGETASFADQAAAQDLVNLLLVAPLLLVLGLRARRGDLRAYLCWSGCVGFTVYNYAIYAFSIRFGPLFLVWVAVLGLSLFALLTSLLTADTSAIRARFVGRAARGPGWFLVVVAALFALLWLSMIVPDLLARRASTTASSLNLPTNPVHVLDLAFFLPAAAASGVLLLHRHHWGYATAPAQLTFLALTCLPIVTTSFVAAGRDHEPGWFLLGPITVVLLGALGALVRLLRAVGPDRRPSRPRARVDV